MSLGFKGQLRHRYDVLVVGGGAAGLRAAIEAKECAPSLNVGVVAKAPIGQANNTYVSEGYLNTLNLAEGDTPEKLAADMLKAGRGLNNRRLVEAFAARISGIVEDLERLGVRFKRVGGKLDFLAIPGHTHPRSVFVPGKGRGLLNPLKAYASRLGISFHEGIMVTRILKNGRRLAGCVGFDKTGFLHIFEAKSLILAAGGAGWIYWRTGNPGGMTGDGYVLALEAGLPLIDMEFIQFYPTYAFGRGLKTLLLYEKLLANGAVLRNRFGENIPAKYGLSTVKGMTRDLFSRAIMLEILEGRGIEGLAILDLKGLDRLAVKEYLSTLESRGIRLGEQMLVSPAAHFTMGGIAVEELCQTLIEGLFAAGEVVGGLHGANRLGGNALSEAFIFGREAGRQASAYAPEAPIVPPPIEEVEAEKARLESLLNGKGECEIPPLQRKLRETLWLKAGVVRSGEGLKEALAFLSQLKGELEELHVKDFHQLAMLLELENMVKVGLMVVESALRRKESRGAHQRIDCPEEKPDWRKNIIITLKNGGLTFTEKPVEDKG